MKQLKHLFSLLLLLGVVAFGSIPATAVVQEKEVPKLMKLQPEDVNDFKVFTGRERSLQDSLQTAEEFVSNEDLKGLLNQLQYVIKNRPDKASSGADWLSWASALFLFLGALAGFIAAKKLNSNPPGSSVPNEPERRYTGARHN